MAGKMRVHELAKELGVAPKMIIDQLEAMGHKERTSSSALEDALIPVIRDVLAERAADFAQRESERLEAERAAAIRARIEAVRNAAAKAARARTRKPETAKPKGGIQKIAVKGPQKAPIRAKGAPAREEVALAVVPVAEEITASVPAPATVVVPAATIAPVVPFSAPPGAGGHGVAPPASPAATGPATDVVPVATPAHHVAPIVSVTPTASPAPSAPRAPVEPVRRPRIEPPPVKRARPRTDAETPQVVEPVGAPTEPAPAPPASAPVVVRPAAERPAEVASPPADGKVVPIRPWRDVAPAAAPAASAPPARVPEREVPAAALPARPAETPAERPPVAEPAAPAAAAAPKRELVRLPESITVVELAERLHRKSAEVIRELLGMRVMASINQVLDLDKAKAVAAKFGFDVELRPLESLELEEEAVDPAKLKPRPPVVTVMGHVDHGKTSLLDAIRKTKVTEQEFGGITQHIGAYQVETSHGRVTFLDTPGHEAFTSMRARGAQATDIVILVVAADDGVMPQTVEAISHAKAANVPIIVAINKVDKADATPDRVKQELANLGLVPEEWGGQTICVPTSAKKGTGVEQLIEMTALQAEMMELKANPDRPGKGVIVEAKLDRGRGPVATVLIQQGTIRDGDVVVAGPHYGRVRAMFNDRRQRVKSAGPVDPVEILGLSGVPSAGDTLTVVPDERKARQIALVRQQQERKVTSTVRVTLADLHKQIEAGEVKELRVIIKGDVHGSLEALQDALERLSTDEVKVRVIHGAVGSLTETDIMLASASNAIVLGFNVKPEPKTLAQAHAERVDVRTYNVIYEAIGDVKAALEGMLAPLIREIPLGKAQVRALFPIKNVGTIAGCFVTEGKITRSGKARLLRGREVAAQGSLASLKRFKDDAREVLQGMECGIGLEGVTDIRVGDVIEVFTTEEVARTL